MREEKSAVSPTHSPAVTSDSLRLVPISDRCGEPVPTFCEGIQFFGEPWPEFDSRGRDPVIRDGLTSVENPSSPPAVFQTLLAADALRYLALQITGTKASGHPGGFASSADLYAALVMLGHTNVVTEAGHHAPGFYAAKFLDASLEEMGIKTVGQLCERFRERRGLLGHISGAMPGILSPAGPLGQGQHFAMAGALLHPDILLPLTLGDGGLGEPYILSSMMHFHVCYPEVTNFLPCLVWNGHSQEHHAMVSVLSNEEMIAYWQGHGFHEVIVADAKDFDDQDQSGAFVDSTKFSFEARLAFTKAVLEGVDGAARSALSGKLTAFVVKQLKGAGTHTAGAKSHNLGPGDTLDKPHIVAAMKRRALTPEAWAVVRHNFRHAGGGPTSQTSVIEKVRPLAPLADLPKQEFTLQESAVPSTAMGALVAAVGRADPHFLVTSADGTEASGMKVITEALGIRHPTPDPLYHQRPDGRVYEPVSEDACAGLAAGVALFGGRSLWLSYESFAVNGLPIWQTVTQAMAELRRKTPSTVVLLTAGALGQGRNGWTHQRPEIESYLAAMIRNGNVYILFPSDANMVQEAYDWALTTSNKGIMIIASKSSLPVYSTPQRGRCAVERGAINLYESAGDDGDLVVFAVTGDTILLPVFESKDELERRGYRVRIISVVNPRRLYRPGDLSWESVAEPDNSFMPDDHFDALFNGDMLIGVSGGPGAPLEPVMLRSSAPRRRLLCWKRGYTVASVGELLDCNALNADDIVEAVRNMAV